MSQCTHVNGNIRFDYMPFGEDKGFEDEIKRVLGEKVDYDHVGLFGKDHQNRPDSHIPRGSEGGIDYYVYKSSRGYNVGIDGDLRDFGLDEVQDIFDWFGKIMNYQFESFFHVREAALYIDIEYGKDFLLIDDRYNEENKKGYKVHEV